MPSRRVNIADEATHPPQPEIEQPAVEATVQKVADASKFAARVLDVLSRFGVLVFLVVLIAAFSIWEPSRFFTTPNAVNILSDQAIPIVLTMGLLLPLSAGEFDLSCGATLSFTAILVAKLSAHGLSIPLVALVVLMTGAVIGLVNAFFVVKVGVSAFIATLAMSTVLAGGNLFFTNGELQFQGLPKELTTIAETRFIDLPMIVWVAAVVSIFLWYVLEFTPFGRYVRASGSGRIAARLSGVRTAPTVAICFVGAGMLAGLAGFLQTARIGSANPNSGPEFLLPAFAAAFLGATVIQRGLFNVWGTVIGALVLAVGINGLTLGGAPFWLPDVFNGGALLIAVSLSVLSAKRRSGTQE
jgi:ribose transport system permease protein